MPDQRSFAKRATLGVGQRSSLLPAVRTVEDTGGVSRSRTS